MIGTFFKALFVGFFLVSMAIMLCFGIAIIYLGIVYLNSEIGLLPAIGFGITGSSLLLGALMMIWDVEDDEDS